MIFRTILARLGIRFEKSQRPPGSGWHAIPGGRRGGFRKRNRRGGYDYWYPDDHHTTYRAPHEGVEATHPEGTDPRLPPPGSQIRRRYGGHEWIVAVGRGGSVAVSRDGGPLQHFDSISAAARAITGHRTNGYRFFGLGTPGEPTPEQAPPPPLPEPEGGTLPRGFEDLAMAASRKLRDEGTVNMGRLSRVLRVVREQADPGRFNPVELIRMLDVAKRLGLMIDRDDDVRAAASSGQRDRALIALIYARRRMAAQLDQSIRSRVNERAFPDVGQMIDQLVQLSQSGSLLEALGQHARIMQRLGAAGVQLPPAPGNLPTPEPTPEPTPPTPPTPDPDAGPPRSASPTDLAAWIGDRWDQWGLPNADPGMIRDAAYEVDDLATGRRLVERLSPGMATQIAAALFRVGTMLRHDQTAAGRFTGEVLRDTSRQALTAGKFIMLGVGRDLERRAKDLARQHDPDGSRGVWDTLIQQRARVVDAISNGSAQDAADELAAFEAAESSIRGRATPTPAPTPGTTSGTSGSRIPPAGTVLRKTYRGQTFTLRVDGPNAFTRTDTGQTFTSLSAAGRSITNNRVNGFRFWGLGAAGPTPPPAELVRPERRRYNVRVEQPERLAPTVRAIFGRDWTADDIAAATGAPQGCDVRIVADAYGMGGIRVEVKGNGFESNTMIQKGRDGVVEASCEWMHVAPEARGRGIGASTVLQGMLKASQMGVQRARCTAGQGGGMNGYYTWPRLGFDGDIGYSAREQLRSSGPAAHRNATRVAELMTTQEGRDWWKRNGHQFSATFDLTPNSVSRQRLNAYMQAKAAAARQRAQRAA